MSEVLEELAAALRERLTIVADEASRRNAEAHMRRLQQISERIEELERQLPATVHPQLRHYLQRRSYSKALEFIEAA
jgi:Tfp pilus assembly protein PilO